MWGDETDCTQKPNGYVPGPPPSPREFLERSTETIAKTAIMLGASVSTAYKAAGVYAEAVEELWRGKEMT